MDQVKRIPKFTKEVKKHFADWICMPVVLKHFRDGPAVYFDEYLNNKDDEAYVATRCDQAHTWHLSQYAHTLYSQEIGRASCRERV